VAITAHISPPTTGSARSSPACLLTSRPLTPSSQPHSSLHKPSSLFLNPGGLPCCQLLGDEETGQTDSDDEDDAEHDNDTGLTASPVAALGDLGDGVASDDGGVDGRHCECGFCESLGELRKRVVRDLRRSSKKKVQR